MLEQGRVCVLFPASWLQLFRVSCGQQLRIASMALSGRCAHETRQWNGQRDPAALLFWCGGSVEVVELPCLSCGRHDLCRRVGLRDMQPLAVATP